MKHQEITFDRFVRAAITLAGIAIALWLLHYLSSVLIPFLLAWFAAYLLYPLVSFLQYKCRLRNRVLSIIVALGLVGGAVGAAAYFSVPPIMQECAHLKNITLQYIDKGADNSTIPQAVQRFFRENASQLELGRLLREGNFVNAVKSAVPRLWDVVWSTAGVIINLVASLIALLYLLFLLIDYEKYARGWIKLVPKAYRRTVGRLASDIEEGMNGYFRGQALIALSNCIMFSIGFLLIDFPMPVGLGLFIGLISFVPYLQVIGILPAIVLALLRAAETGENFWWLIGGVLLVYIVVQIIQDVLVTPHVMGRIMHLSPAVILLSLSIWGYLLGIVGLIIALPVTTLTISYYRRFVLEEEDSESDA